MFQRNYLVFILIASTIFLSFSCTQYKKVVYMHDHYEVKDTAMRSISVEESGEMRLMTGDNLFVNVYGVDLGQIEIFKKQSSYNQNFTEYSLAMQGYVIDNNGEIELPIVGKIKIVGNTLSQTKELIQNSIDEYIVGAVVEVRLLSFQVTVLGEVRRPGTYTFINRDVSVLDALGKAGDVMDFGDRGSLLIVRKSKSHAQTIQLDLTSSNFFNEVGYWLEPNDVVYVKPLRAKMININGTTISIVLAGLTTLILFLTYMQY